MGKAYVTPVTIKEAADMPLSESDLQGLLIKLYAVLEVVEEKSHACGLFLHLVGLLVFR